ncbi:hypothetical protein [Methylobacterium sp. WL8]|uniref:hypothetical protein n=1 Tax=Methylobacterium sp. WL8 TaxID=2603899 RepID=UPI0011CC5C5C|nr:hypothetical protein [Methylobacterium sp. WL8]TXN78276.1 hypothetical protein FV234_22945 [Methylobacterium sp. WL8]
MARQPRQFARQGAASDLPDRASVRAYVGPPGEPIWDGEALRVHDGSTPGGVRLARTGRKAVTDQNYVVVLADTYVALTALTALTAARLVTLPSAAAYAPGQVLYVADETGACSADAGLTITVAAAGTDTIAGQPSVALGSPYQKLAFHSNGSNLWTFA